MSNSKEKLFNDFPPVSTQQWMEKITTDLKGADFERRLVWRTNEGFNVHPFYRREDIDGYPWTENLPGQFPYVRSTKKTNTWYVRQEIKVHDFAEANQQAQKWLTHNVNALGFDLPKKELTAENIAILLKDINPEKVELNFRTCIRHTLKLAQLVVDYLTAQNVNLDKCQGSIEFDPYRKILLKGQDAPEWEKEIMEMVKITAPLPHYRSLIVSGNYFNNAGAYIYQELGYSLSYGNQLLHTLVENGVDPTTAANNIKFKLGIGSNYFMEIAKFRAARWLWSQIVNAYKSEAENDADKEAFLQAAKINMHAITSWFNLTMYDPNVNLLRTQTEAMSAAIAEVDSITVTPFNSTYETPNAFSERIAVNQQLLLMEESHLNKVTDPSAGSYYIENLTKSIAEQAWKLFLETEEKGFYNALKEGSVQDTINAAADNRFKALARRKEVLLGTNQYPNFNEKINTKIANDKKPVGCGCTAHGETPLKSLNRIRLAEPFEQLRLATEGHYKRPKVFMLTIGNLAMRLARSQFSSNFFACAGYEIIDNLGFKTVEEGVNAAREKEADIIVLCSSDDEYATYAPEAFKLIDGKELFVVAGAPACTDELKAQGIEHFIHVRSNVLETLTMFNEKLNIAPLG